MSGPEIAVVAGTLAAVFVVRILLWFVLRRSVPLVRSGVPYLSGPAAQRRTRPIRDFLRARFPRFYRWLVRRIHPGRFEGLPLTLIAVAALYLAFLFAGLVEELFESEELEAADQAIIDAVAAFRHPNLVIAFGWITEFGSVATLTAVAVVSTGFLWAHGPQREIMPVWLTVAGAQLTTWGGKFVLARPRPEFVLEITAYSPSFPSGHTTGALAVYGILAYVISRDLATPRQSFEIIYWTCVLILLIAFSRIFLNVHYPSDVAAGLLVGGFWLIAGIALAEILRRRPLAP